MAVVQERLVEVEADESVVSDRRPVGEEKTFRRYDPDQVLLMAQLAAGDAEQVSHRHLMPERDQRRMDPFPRKMSRINQAHRVP
jgi:hypothetical protein